MFVFVFVVVYLLVRSCLLITLIKRLAAATLPVDAAAAAAAAGEANMLVEINLKKKLVQDFLPTIGIAQWS